MVAPITIGAGIQVGSGVSVGPSPYSFTLTSADISSANYFGYYNGNAYPAPIGTNGVDGFTLTFYAGQPAGYYRSGNIPYAINIGSTDIVAYFNSLVTQGVIGNAYEDYLWEAQWAPGSTHTNTYVALSGVGNPGNNMFVCPLDPADPTYNQSVGYAGSRGLEGTYLFPATFTLVRPTVTKGGWC